MEVFGEIIRQCDHQHATTSRGEGQWPATGVRVCVSACICEPGVFKFMENVDYETPMY